MNKISLSAVLKANKQTILQLKDRLYVPPVSVERDDICVSYSLGGIRHIKRISRQQINKAFGEALKEYGQKIQPNLQ